jgi:hypothetical protein
MHDTASTALRRGVKTLSLREKIFELHDAVKSLQTKQTKIDKTEKTVAKRDSSSAKIEQLEHNSTVLK